MNGLGELSGGLSLSDAYGVSADGTTVVGYSHGASGYEAFRWTAGVMAGLGDFAGGSFASVARAVSGDGATVVGSGAGPAGSRAFRWTGGVMSDIGSAGTARAISSDGSTIVGFYNEDPFRWKDGVATPLEEFPVANASTLAYDVSGDGSIAVGSAGPAENLYDHEAVFWNANGIHEIDRILTGLGVDLTGWELIEATSISDDGSTIVGWGMNPDGFAEGWIAEIPGIAAIPEPGTGLLLALGLLGLAVLRRC
jgi:probable HAF family extracellular repeat protein